MTRLDFLQRLVVVDELRRVVKIDDDFRIAVGQEAIDLMFRIKPREVNEIVDKLIERKGGDVNLENHLRAHSLTGLTGFSRRIGQFVGDYLWSQRRGRQNCI